MRAEASAAVVVVVLLLPTALAEPWLQSGHDAARTARTNDPGPAYFGEAFRVQLEGARAANAVPIILDGGVFVLTRAFTQGHPAFIADALWRIDLDTAHVREVARWDASPDAIVSDGTVLYVMVEGRVEALRVTSGELVWATSLDRLLPMDVRVTRSCVEPALRGDVLLVGCTEWLDEGQGVASQHVGLHEEESARSEYGVAALDRRTGDVVWTWDSMRGREQDRERTVQGMLEDGDRTLLLDDTGHHSDVAPRLVGLAFAGPNAYVMGTQGDDEQAALAVVDALDAVSGTGLWRWYHLYGADDTDGGPEHAWQNAPAPTMAGDDDRLYLLHKAMYSFDHASGDFEYLALGEPLKADDVDAWTDTGPHAGHSLALTRDELFAGHGRSLSGIIRDPEEVGWTADLGDTAWAHDIIAARGLLYTTTSGGSTFLVAIRASDGLILHRHDLGWPEIYADTQEPIGFNSDYAPGLHGVPWHRIGVGDGVVAVAARNGTVVIMGETGASIGFHLRSADAYPAPGEPFSLEMRNFRPGVLAPDVSYRIDWGDGPAERLGVASLANHTYVTAGEYVVSVTAHNSAGQTTVRTFPVHVGGTAPREPTFLEKAFSPQYEDRTWGVIGLIVVVAGALLTLLGVYRRRSILRRELQGIDDAVAGARPDGARIERALRERKEHVRALLLGGRIDESQFAVLDGRITELQREGRLDLLDQRLPFLPHGLAQTLRKMLADGHISSWEHETVMSLVKDDGFLTKGQKTKVAELLASWRQEDAG